MAKFAKGLIKPILSTIFLIFVGVFLWRNWSHMAESAKVLSNMSASFVWKSLPLMFLTFVLAACSYFMLIFRRVRLTDLLLLELAAASVNRVLPSGLGGLGVHGLYLHKKKHTVAQATAVVSINNLLGIAVHCLVLVIVVAMTPFGKSFNLGVSEKQGWFLLGIVLTLLTVTLLPRMRRRIRYFSKNLLRSLRLYGDKPHRLFYAALSLLALTMVNLLILHVAANSLGVFIDAPRLFIIYSMGVLLGASVPTPGGLVGVEAGLVAGFMAYDVSSATAIAITLAFRFITYWAPILPGLVALYAVRARSLL